MPFHFGADTGDIAPGQYDVEIVEAVEGVNSKGNPNLRVVFEAPDGAQLADWLVALPQVRWRWQQLWSAAGLTFPDDGGDVDEGDLIGRRVHIEVIEDTYDGRTRSKVKEVSRPVGSDIPNDPVVGNGAASARADTADPFEVAAARAEDDVPF